MIKVLHALKDQATEDVTYHLQTGKKNENHKYARHEDKEMHKFVHLLYSHGLLKSEPEDEI